MGFALPMHGQATAQANPPTEVQRNCTRGSNPYQDLKDTLNLVTGDLLKAASANGMDQRRLGKRIKKTWKNFSENAHAAKKEIPASLDHDVNLATMGLIEPQKTAIGQVTPNFLNLTAHSVDDYSMTMTCTE